MSCSFRGKKDEKQPEQSADNSHQNPNHAYPGLSDGFPVVGAPSGQQQPIGGGFHDDF